MNNPRVCLSVPWYIVERYTYTKNVYINSSSCFISKLVIIFLSNVQYDDQPHILLEGVYIAVSFLESYLATYIKNLKFFIHLTQYFHL